MMRMRNGTALLVGLAVTCLLAACAANDFRHDFAGPRPWTDTPFDSASGKFTFAVHADLNGGERDRVFEIAVAQLSLLRPEFIMNVGDLIEGDAPDVAGLNAQWDAYDARAGRASAPVFYTGGNHDLTGEVLQGIWDERYGRRYYHFVYKNVLFLVLDTEDNSAARIAEIHDIRSSAIKVLDEQGYEPYTQTEYFRLPERNAGNITATQSQYFRDVIAAHPDVRWTFLFLHKAPWLRDDDRNFAAIEDALTERPYTVFHGHAHTFQYLERRGRDYIRLATTGGIQVAEEGRSMDHILMVTVDDNGVDIANLPLAGILDKTGHIPLGGDDVCFEAAVCGTEP